MAGVREEAIAFVVENMKKNPDISMGELKSLGKAKKINVYPLIIGYAKKQLGLGKATPAAKRGPGRPPGKRGPGRPPGKRGPGRPPASGAAPRGPGRPAGRPVSRMNDPAAAGHRVIAHVRELEKEVATLRAALGKISEIARGG